MKTKKTAFKINVSYGYVFETKYEDLNGEDFIINMPEMIKHFLKNHFMWEITKILLIYFKSQICLMKKI